MQSLLFDTDVIIDHLRGYQPATHYLLEKKSNSLFVSAITVSELFSGIKTTEEQNNAESILQLLQTIPVDHEIAVIGGRFRKEYKNSHGTGLMDALIAATALHHEATLITLNTRHFPMVKTIKPYDK